MSKLKTWLLLLLAVGLMVVSVAQISAKSSTDKPVFTIRKVEKQVVLYTIYRGSYEKIGPAVGKLFALAGRNGISPRGPVSYVYLNNPKSVTSEHWLTEVRIPVGKEALKLAGTLGEMTDVKALPAMEVAVAVKPEGQSDPVPIYEKIYRWILKEGYIAAEGPVETFFTNVDSGDYAQMKTEIMFPVGKLSQQKD